MRAERAVTTGTKAWELFSRRPDGDRGPRRPTRSGTWPTSCADGDVVEGVAIDSRDGRDILRHSTAHVMAQAVQELFPDAKLGIGPPINDGFYYDFDVAEPFVPEDLEKIETRMRKIVKEGQRFSRRAVSDGDALGELADEPYKLELIGLKGGSATPAERRRGRRRRGRRRRAHHLRQPQARRLAGVEGPVPRPAPAHHQADPGVQADAQRRGVLARRREEQAAAADLRHRLGVQGGARGAPAPHRGGRAARPPQARPRARPLLASPTSSAPVWRSSTPRAGVIKREMEDYVRRRHIEEGFDYVGTPHIRKEGLFHTSGHLPYYADGMFPPMEMEGAHYRLKAMNCPMHNLIFRSRGRSYRELPLRLFEFGGVYRNEKSGVVHGLTRVRGMTQDDSHSYVTPEQAPAEIKHLLDFCLGLFRDFGLDDYYLELSTRDDSKPDKFVGSDEEWAEATAVLEQVATDSGLELVPDPGGAAYYGPKISVQARDAIGRTWQMSTIQYDFNQPRRVRARVPGGRRLAPAAGDDPLREVRLDRAVHRRARRALRRRLPALAGAGAGAGDPDRRAAQRLPRRRGRASCERAGIRVEVDDSDDRMQKKIRNAQLQKVPFMLIAGDRDVEEGAVSFRYRDGDQDNGVAGRGRHRAGRRRRRRRVQV